MPSCSGNVRAWTEANLKGVASGAGVLASVMDVSAWAHDSEANSLSCSSCPSRGCPAAAAPETAGGAGPSRDARLWPAEESAPARHVQHPGRWVHSQRARAHPRDGLHVGDQQLAPRADGSEVRHVPAALHEQDLVKLEEDVGAWLVNGGDDGAPGVGDLAHLPDDHLRRPGVQPGSGLVQEENGRVGDELHGHSEDLALTGGEAICRANLTNQPVLDGPQLQQVQHLLHEGGAHGGGDGALATHGQPDGG